MFRARCAALLTPLLPGHGELCFTSWRKPELRAESWPQRWLQRWLKRWPQRCRFQGSWAV